MKKRISFSGLILFITFFAAFFLSSCATGPTADELRTKELFNRAEKKWWRLAGLAKMAISVDGDSIVYLEGGKGETVVLLHGFADSKDAWVDFAKPLTRSYHVVIPDLPGFGESTKRLYENYNIDRQVGRLDRFVEALGQKRFHLAGNSMGGAIAAVYAARFPRKVITLALLDPMGVVALKIPPRVIETTGDYEKMLPHLFFRTPHLPEPFRKTMTKESFEEAMVARFKAARRYNEIIWLDLAREDLSLGSFLPAIKAPVLIVWGDHDGIFDVSGASILAKGLKDHRTVILEDTGHLPMTEKPAQTAAAYGNFLQSRQGM
ncbi:MAG: alpha/beta hydrolase [Syntrophobacteraceae bacterium]|nr:alpha/beta hydrolase [Syntrophobacteraceae bacterium]